MTGPSGRAESPAGTTDAERQRRWRLMLGGESDLVGLGGDDTRIDGALGALYDRQDSIPGNKRSAGLGASAPSLARWLGDIRSYFPNTVVQVMQQDALDRLNIRALLAEPELMTSLEPDVHLASTLISLGRALPETSRSTARMVVRVVVEKVEQRIANRTRQAVSGALNRSARTSRPRPADIDWSRTIGRNLRHYLPEYKTIIPETLVGYGRRQPSFNKEIVLAIDQSGSMAASVVYASIFGAVIASLKSVRTSLITFDTEIADLTELLDDPVDVLFGTQLGGGTDINRAIAYSRTLITRPTNSLFVLISDLYEGGVRNEMLARVAAMLRDGIQVVVLLALSDEGAPSFDREIAGALHAMGVPAFACTPDAFPDLLAVALSGGDIGQWAAREQLDQRGMGKSS